MPGIIILSYKAFEFSSNPSNIRMGYLNEMVLKTADMSFKKTKAVITTRVATI